MDYKYYNKKIKGILNETSRNCLINVTRRLGATTTLLEYAVEFYTKTSKSVVLCFHKKSCFGKMFDIVEEHIKPFKEFFEVDKTNYMVKHVLNKENSIVFTTPSSNFRKVMSGNNSLNDIKLLIVDNADFCNWVKLKKLVEEKHDFLKTVAVSCPSPFKGKWTDFKKTYITEPFGWCVRNITGEFPYDSIKPIFIYDYDMQCNNYKGFFEPMKMLYKNMGEFLFLENAPLYTKYNDDVSNDSSSFLNISKWALENRTEIKKCFNN